MYFVTIPTANPQATIVGIAESGGNFALWGNDRPLPSTLHPIPAPGQAVVESPHAFLYQGKWWLTYTPNQTDVYAISNPNSPVDPVSSNWSSPQHVNALIIDEFSGQPTNAYNYWKAAEFLQVNASNNISYFAAWNDQAVGISYIPVLPAQVPYLFKEHCPVNATAVEEPGIPNEPRLELLGPRPTHSHIRLRVELPGAMRVSLAIFDVAGRRLRALLNGDLPAGRSDISWDGRDENGILVASGVYFVNLTLAGGRHTVRTVLIR